MSCRSCNRPLDASAPTHGTYGVSVLACGEECARRAVAGDGPMWREIARWGSGGGIAGGIARSYILWGPEHFMVVHADGLRTFHSTAVTFYAGGATLVIGHDVDWLRDAIGSLHYARGQSRTTLNYPDAVNYFATVHDEQALARIEAALRPADA